MATVADTASLKKITEVAGVGESTVHELGSSQEKASEARATRGGFFDTTTVSEDARVNLKVTKELEAAFTSVKNEANAALAALDTNKTLPQAEVPIQATTRPAWMKKAQQNQAEEVEAGHLSTGMGY